MIELLRNIFTATETSTKRETPLVVNIDINESEPLRDVTPIEFGRILPGNYELVRNSGEDQQQHPYKLRITIDSKDIAPDHPFGNQRLFIVTDKKVKHIREEHRPKDPLETFSPEDLQKRNDAYFSAYNQANLAFDTVMQIGKSLQQNPDYQGTLTFDIDCPNEPFQIIAKQERGSNEKLSPKDHARVYVDPDPTNPTIEPFITDSIFYFDAQQKGLPLDELTKYADLKLISSDNGKAPEANTNLVVLPDNAMSGITAVIQRGRGNLADDKYIDAPLVIALKDPKSPYAVNEPKYLILEGSGETKIFEGAAPIYSYAGTITIVTGPGHICARFEFDQETGNLKYVSGANKGHWNTSVTGSMRKKPPYEEKLSAYLQARKTNSSAATEDTSSINADKSEVEEKNDNLEDLIARLRPFAPDWKPSEKPHISSGHAPDRRI